MLDYEFWTVENNLLTPTGKPSRNRIRAKFQIQMEQTYADLTQAAPDGVCEEETHVVADFEETVDSSDRPPSLAGEMEEIVISIRDVADLKVTVPKILSLPMQFVASNVGTSGVDQKLIKFGFLDQHEENLPCYPNSTKKEAIGFVFKGKNDSDSSELNSVLDVMREEALKRRELASAWRDETKEKKNALDVHVSEVYAHETALVENEMKQFCLTIEKIITDHLSGNADIVNFVAVANPLMQALSHRLVEVRRAYKEISFITPSEEKEESLKRYREHQDVLSVLAPRRGVRIPYNITYGVIM